MRLLVILPPRATLAVATPLLFAATLAVAAPLLVAAPSGAAGLQATAAARAEQSATPGSTTHAAPDISGLISVPSPHTVAATTDRLVAEIAVREIRLFARIDHGRNAMQVGTDLEPQELVIFGNAAMGSKLMDAAPTIGIDLPLRALVWRDIRGQVWLSYNDPAILAARHGLPQENAVVQKMQQVLAKLAEAATR